MLPRYTKISIVIHSNTTDRVSVSNNYNSTPKKFLEEHYAYNASVLTELRLNKNNNLVSLDPNANTQDLIPYVFDIDKNDLEKMTAAKLVSQKIKNNLDAVPFKKHTTFDNTSQMLAYYNQNTDALAVVAKESKDLSKLHLDKKPAYSALKVDFIDAFRVADLPSVLSLIELCKVAEPLVAYNLQHAILFSIGLKAFFNLYNLIIDNNGTTSILKNIAYTLESKKPLFF
jgi:hypothetical protein